MNPARGVSPVVIESAEIAAWVDMIAAAPPEFAAAHGLSLAREGEVMMVRCKTIPFVHFVCVLNAGLLTPLTDGAIDRITQHFEQAGVRGFTFFAVPASQPADLAAKLERRGFKPNGGWDRITRGHEPLAAADTCSPDLAVERVTSDTAAEWAAFIDRVYGLPTSPWLLALVGRPGWHHYLVRRAGGIAAVRSLYRHYDGTAWLGIDAPVPGVMAPSFELDAALCRAIVRDGLAAGVRRFVTDIELPSPTMDTPAYRDFAALGFERVYLRRHFHRPGT